MNKSVAIGRIPRLNQCTDRWGLPIKRWDVPEPVYVTPELWYKMQLFQNPVFKEEHLEYIYEYTELLLLLNPTKGTGWQFNAPNQNGELCRNVIFFYDNSHFRFVEWGRVDFLKAGVFRILARFLNWWYQK